MKLTTFTTISMLLAIIFDKTQADGNKCGNFRGMNFDGTDGLCYTLENCWENDGYELYKGPYFAHDRGCYGEIDLGDGSFLCPANCCLPCSARDCAISRGDCHVCSQCSRRLASDERIWSSQQLVNCPAKTPYEGHLGLRDGHLFLFFKPEDEDSKCPSVAVDSGKMDADSDTLAPHVSILDESPAEGLALDHSLTLGGLSEALSQMDLADYSIPVDEYNLIGNNCGTFLLHFVKEIGFDYHEAARNATIVNYVSKSLVANKDFVDKVREAYRKENTGIFQQMKFSVWEYYVGDEGMARALVKRNVDIME